MSESYISFSDWSKGKNEWATEKSGQVALQLLNVHVRSLHKHFGTLQVLISKYLMKLDVIILTEIYITEDSCSQFQIKDSKILPYAGEIEEVEASSCMSGTIGYVTALMWFSVRPRFWLY